MKTWITVAVFALMLRAATAARSQEAEPAKDAPARLTRKEKPAAVDDESDAGQWPLGLLAGKRRAQAENRPLLVRVGSVSCGWCAKLVMEIKKPVVEHELARWSLAYIDADAAPNDARQLNVTGIPALRILNSRGKLIASRDGFLTAEELAAWLKEQIDSAVIATPEVLTDAAPPDAAAVEQLIAQFKKPDPIEREAAIRRLLPHPKVAAHPVVEAFGQGKLATRLAALEVLREWQAPITGLDPWRVDTLTAQRQQALVDWAKTVGDAPTARALELSPEQRNSAERDVARLLTAPEEEAEALRERLARFGSALLPVVYQQWKTAATDLARERLLTLRYRLVATDALVLGWPGGLLRLAAQNVDIRHKAAQELADRATAGDEPLFLELFSDPDPLVREISLRGLQAVGGSEATAALVKLLADPEPNVRAAVLKQLAESPVSSLVAKIAEYVAAEKDADLLVHAVRVLKETKNTAAAEVLITLLKHESWQVRAEAAEALGKMEGDETRTADILVALIDLLDDSDAFVVSRALGGMGRNSLPSMIEPLARVADKHPALAKQAITNLIQNQELRPKAMPHLRRFATHAASEVRAAALAGLVTAVPADCDRELIAGLTDPESNVRQAAAEGIFSICTNNLNDGSAEQKRDKSLDMEDWLLKFRSGVKRPEWMAKAVEPLEKLLSAKATPERLAAALVLIPLAREEVALPVLQELAQAEPAHRGAVGGALPWLPWDQRLKLFQFLVALKPETEAMGEIAQGLATIIDPRARDSLWKLLDQEVGADLPTLLYQHLARLYDANYYNNDQGKTPQLKTDDPRLIELTRYASAGLPWQKALALAILVTLSPAEADELAAKTLEDASAPADVRRDALQVRLVIASHAAAERLAIAHLGTADGENRKLALTFLTKGTGSMRYLRSGLYLGLPSVSFSSSSETVVIEPPKGLSSETLRPLLTDAEPDTAAMAGYLLAIMGQPEGLPPLRKHWKGATDESWTPLLYRAIVALDDASSVPLLYEIYRKLDRYEARSFYWTIRGMHGPEILKLRKTIRDEVGMDNLR